MYHGQLALRSGHGCAPGVLSCNRCRVGSADVTDDGSGELWIGGCKQGSILSLASLCGGLFPSGPLTVSLAFEEPGSTRTD